MRNLLGVTMVAGFSLAAAGALAQPPGGGRRDGSASTADNFIGRLLAYDANGDGKLSKAELTDKRLQPLFDRGDADHDGVVTKQELQALYERESLAQAGGGRGGPPDGPRGPGGPDGPGRGFGGPGGPGGPREPGMGGPPRPGEVVPAFLQDRLELTEMQKKQLEALQKDVDDRLAKILTKEQKQQLDDMRNNDRRPPDGPVGFGPPRGGRDGGRQDGGRQERGRREDGRPDRGPQRGGPAEGRPGGVESRRPGNSDG